MPDQPMTDLENQLAAANENVARLTAENEELLGRLSDAELLAKKMKRNSRRDSNSLRSQLEVAQNLRRQ